MTQRSSKPSLLCGGGCPRSGREKGFSGALLIAATLVLTTPALADDALDCSAGIAMIQSEIAKAPAEPVLAKLKKALKVAEREQKEREFDECLDAVGDAKRAVK